LDLEDPHTVTARGRRPAGRQHATDYRSRLTVWEEAESREVVLAQKGVSTDAHRGDIERARNVPRAMVEQRIGPRRTEQAVAVTPGGRRVARVEAVGRDPSLDHRNGRSELAAERPPEPLQQHPGLRLSRRPLRNDPLVQIRVDDLSQRVHTGIGPAGTGQ